MANNMNKIILSADSTCDIGPKLQQKYNVHFFNFHIQLEGKSYIDKVEISAQEIFDRWYEKKVLPKTAAITPEDYRAFFEKWVNDGYDIIHINLGSGLSAAHQNCKIIADELGHIYTVDSASLSSGSGLLVAKAGEMIESGMSAKEIQQKLIDIRTKTNASFILDTLDFMAAGGRCSTVQAFGANILNIKPSIVVNNLDGGKMSVGKKYRGKMEKVLENYVRDQLEGKDNLDLSRIFITYPTAPPEMVEHVKAQIKKYQNFENIYNTVASGTIGSHCGPGTLGILFMTK